MLSSHRRWRAGANHVGGCHQSCTILGSFRIVQKSRALIRTPSSSATIVRTPTKKKKKKKKKKNTETALYVWGRTYGSQLPH